MKLGLRFGDDLNRQRAAACEAGQQLEKKGGWIFINFIPESDSIAETRDYSELNSLHPLRQLGRLKT